VQLKTGQAFSCHLGLLASRFASWRNVARNSFWLMHLAPAFPPLLFKQTLSDDALIQSLKRFGMKSTWIPMV